jgi:hypothetical protein
MGNFGCLLWMRSGMAFDSRTPSRCSQLRFVIYTKECRRYRHVLHARDTCQRAVGIALEISDTIHPIDKRTVPGDCRSRLVPMGYGERIEFIELRLPQASVAGRSIYVRCVRHTHNDNSATPSYNSPGLIPPTPLRTAQTLSANLESSKFFEYFVTQNCLLMYLRNARFTDGSVLPASGKHSYARVHRTRCSTCSRRILDPHRSKWIGIRYKAGRAQGAARSLQS